MDQLEILALASTEFARRLAVVPADTFEDPSTCDEWSVGGLIGHVVGGNRMGTALLGGATAEEAIALISDLDLSTDPVADFTASADAMAAAFATADLDTIVHHPAFDMPAGQLLGFRITDLVVHAWDLARSTGGDEVLDERLVAGVWAAIEPVVPMMGVSGVFGEGPSGTVDDAATLQLRVLDACGRRP